jgi:hypothetical protein
VLVGKRFGSAEKRTIWVANLEDRIVDRGALQIVRPLLAPHIDPLTFSWQWRGAAAALAHAVNLVTTEGRAIWIAEDLRNAFDQVPRERLSQILRHYVPNDQFCGLVEQLAARPARRGILQGSSLSPALLDLYLSHMVHRQWRRNAGRPELLRYVDDLTICCRTDDDVTGLYRTLSKYIRDAGMQPKFGAERAIVDIRERPVSWLGYRIRLIGDKLAIRSALFWPATGDRLVAKHQSLVAKFARLHERPSGWHHANSVIGGIVAYLAPTLPFENPQRVYSLISKAAEEAGFGEIWSLEQTLEHWQEAHDHWLQRLKASAKTAGEVFCPRHPDGLRGTRPIAAN